ncbi:hypothetical protein ACWFQ7_29300 [Streptomyces bacillaris]|uniref:Uncharacterized protein n=1 Tax=Streptomyces cavourensis TaxID=67258 RepID=A0ABY5FIV0_9ACTN|nr:hypothetical protein [Streptomyces cavourensis]UTR83688.1 hypothetical protein NLU04_34830 [Streptomyces cavourensis]
MTTTIPLPSAPVSSVCPTCQLIFEACRCTGYTDQHHRLVRQLVADGDRRARRAGRQAPRTLQEMAPGLDRQPVLRMVDRPLVFTPTSSKARAGADDACVLCGRWLCGGNCFAPAPTPSMRAVTA